MKYIFLAVLWASVCCIVIPIYGQSARKNPKAGETKPADSQPPKIDAVNVDTVNVAKLNIHQQPEPAGKSDDKSKESQFYFSRFVTPENFNQWVLCLVGIAGIIVAVCTVKTIQRQTKVFHGQLIAMQRPKIAVKWVFIVPTLDVNSAPILRSNADWKIGCTISNTGGSKAHIERSSLTVRQLGIGSIENLLPTFPPYGNKYSFGQFTLQPGERTERVVTLDHNDAQQFAMWHVRATKGNVTTTPVICFGFLYYRDETGVARNTGFGWQWNTLDMGFTRLDNPNYEYTD